MATCAKGCAREGQALDAELLSPESAAALFCRR
jgi:hypothetical protein